MPDQATVLRIYVREIREILSRGDATEHTYRPAFKALLQGLEPSIVATNDPRRIACGAPDFIVSRGEVTVGYVEAKDVGENLHKAQATPQLKRYRAALRNLVLTDYLEFRWYTDGELRETARLGTPGPDGAVTTTDDGRSGVWVRAKAEGEVVIIARSVTAFGSD